jgi:uncharacterized protein YdeI (YjbR/CyaY-like superfamily)
MPRTPDGLPMLAFADAEAFLRWLEAPACAQGAWLKFARNNRASTLSKAEAIDCALRHGWIDGQIARLDDDYFLIRFTPRKANSRWSARNVARANALIAEGRMLPRGLAEIAAAKADGRWAAAYPSPSKVTAPPDFMAALTRDAHAAAFFAALDSANRYAVLYRLHHAKPGARAARIAALVDMLARGQTFHPPRQKRRAKAAK